MPGSDGKIALYALTGAGLDLARILMAALARAELHVSRRLAPQAPEGRVFDRLAPALARNFRAYDGHVLFCASGIVVRALAPLLEHKAKDPGVVVVDQQGRWAVSLVAGHLGGANELAQQVAEVLGGQAVITTATDSAGAPSLELAAKRAGCRVENLGALARLSGDLLAGRRVGVFDPEGWLGRHLTDWPDDFDFISAEPSPLADAPPLVWVGWRGLEPPKSWLVVRPPCLCVGLGCNRGTTLEELRSFLDGVFKEKKLSRSSIACLASLEAKSDESGLLALAEELKVGVRFFSTDRINGIKAPNPSEVVERHMGVKSVCEAAAMLAADSPRLLVEKIKRDNATLAVALASSM